MIIIFNTLLLMNKNNAKYLIKSYPKTKDVIRNSPIYDKKSKLDKIKVIKELLEEKDKNSRSLLHSRRYTGGCRINWRKRI